MINPFRHHLVRYVLVGMSNVALDYAVLNLGVLALRLSVPLSVFLGFLAANSLSYYLHSRWTFAYDTSGKEAQKLSHFFLVGAVSLGLTEGIVRLGTVGLGINYNLAKAAAVVVSAAWAYLATRFWVFRKPAED